MPIKRELYPEEWERISFYIRFVRAKGRCEGTEYHPDCRAVHGRKHPETGAVVVLTTAHLDHNPSNNAPENLRSLCQRCHNHFDGMSRQQKKREGRLRVAEQAGQIALFEVVEDEPMVVEFPDELLPEELVIRVSVTDEVTDREEIVQLGFEF
ncbi:hypothetical protein KFU94_00945 [Chloroflexi bacterium TSY]|nr:hypothetical protein [Chloroflexi bacterium TSY]